MSQIEEHLNSKIEEILKEIKANKNSDRETDDKNYSPGPFSSRNNHLNKRHASTIKTEFRIIASLP